jgi:hypothetical protein
LERERIFSRQDQEVKTSTLVAKIISAKRWGSSK